MTEQEKDNIFYVCTLIEYISRQTMNHRGDILKCLTDKDLEKELRDAQVNHCLSLEEVADEWLKKYHIRTGTFDTVKECKYTVPSVTAIGRVYQQLVLDTCKKDEIVKNIRDVFTSFISDEISDFNTNVYYSNPDYLRCSYEEGVLLT